MASSGGENGRSNRPIQCGAASEDPTLRVDQAVVRPLAQPRPTFVVAPSESNTAPTLLAWSDYRRSFNLRPLLRDERLPADEPLLTKERLGLAPEPSGPQCSRAHELDEALGDHPDSTSASLEELIAAVVLLGAMLLGLITLACLVILLALCP